jgi:hypothetical protein
MYSTESQRERPTGDDVDRAPRGPMGPRPRPASWAAGMAPFGRCRLAIAHTRQGPSPGNLHRPPTHFSGTALGAGTNTNSGTLGAPVWAEA